MTRVSLPEGCCRRVLLDLTFAGPPVVSHQTIDGFTGTGAFSVSGQLMAFANDFESPAVFQHTIAGTGAATVGFLLGGDRSPGAFATYVFLPAAPTPEPGTFMLLATGAVALAIRRRRGRVKDPSFQRSRG